MDMLWWAIIILLFILAYVGLVAPALPDAPLMIAGFAVYHFLIDSEPLGFGFWITTLILAILLILVDYFSSSVAVKKYGGNAASVTAAIVGVVLFPFIMGPVGVIVGPFLCVFVLELLLKKSFSKALYIAYGTLVGFLGGILMKLIVMTGLIIWFLVLVLF
ncbi:MULTISPECIES: DUF456 domain-containing protein [Thermoactinomyces]|jgi:uncharacterized protein|uniref:DUF456 family protein n=1 Tax=Thermoactinomyces vulgaris TaxID=2026 RepID=A0ABS0QIY3_THEVU|nr:MULTISPECIES: DUF456 family protein [Thermoactinomyces]KFZ39884.1 hypothetical protein JS81_11220 [Thermoactinomyces sp. Gus2-1]KYQ85980.1 hypothetical protein AYX07_11280 [Thermoactinomyces sp. AS95]MBA4552286.1 DUF456 family protein [Thermoactinomyces vulgaris]MBA4597287.1 DUF456 family protein [Thermoactinomyces vulgaris]MBH8582572.1 DUF456 family protein [Thermoactinomyces sp. CICC 10735]